MKKPSTALVIPQQKELITQENMPKDKLQQITIIARKQYELEREIGQLGVTLKEKNEQLATVRTVDLPNALKAAGVQSLTLGGRKGSYVVSVKDIVYGNIKEENKPAAFAWLRANKFGSLIKNVFSCSFGMGEDARARALRVLLRKNKFAYDQKEDIHYQTLQAFVRERLGLGKELPSTIEYTTVPTSIIKESKDVEA